MKKIIEPKIFTIKLDIHVKDLARILDRALGNLTTNWATIEDATKPQSFDNFFAPKRPNNKGISEKDGLFWAEYVLNKGGSLRVSNQQALDNGIGFEEERESRILSLNSVQKGLRVFANDYPHYFGEFLSGNYNEDVADTFLQCCIFGEVRYL